MRNAALPALCIVLGAAGGFAAGLLAPPAAPAPAPGRAVLVPSPGDLAALERRVDEMAAAAERRAGAPSVPAGNSPGAAAPAADAALPLADRVAALESRLAALERGGAREKRYADSLQVLGEYLRRADLTAEQRTEAEMQAGYALRGLGRHSEAEARFRETLGRVGETTAEGAWAQFQVGWERKFQRDPAGGSVEMEKAADNPSVSPVTRVHALYNAAQFAREAGEVERARALYERLLERHGGDFPASQANMKQAAEQSLRELRGN
ncbi:MAG: hypothetical protein L6R43_03815 [Planctomycetes bacterium]|nr:hypothetical protein [Planctomycetota bacterium]